MCVCVCMHVDCPRRHRIICCAVEANWEDGVGSCPSISELSGRFYGVPFGGEGRKAVSVRDGPHSC